MVLTMANLEDNFKAAKHFGAEFVAILVRMEGFPDDEVIVNRKENFDNKLDYYKKTYDENLQHKFANGISIVGFTYGNYFSDIKADLYPGDEDGPCCDPENEGTCVEKKNTVTQEQIDKIMSETEFDVKTIFGKVTVVTAKLPNGFTIVDSSACVDPANYSEEMGAEIVKKRIENEVWKLEGYLLQEKLYRAGIL